MALLNVDFFSESIGMCMQMEVILPQRTQGQIGMKGARKDGKIPVLYLLHGMSDDHTIWMRRTSIERYVSDMGIAVVMPTTHLGWYTDVTYGSRYWTYLSEELPEICHSFFRDLSDEREDTFAAGLSMGGYGALKLGLGTNRYGAVASLSGALDIARVVGESDAPDSLAYWGSIFGELDKVKGSDQDLFRLAEKQSGNQNVLEETAKQTVSQAASGGRKGLPKIFLCCGTEDRLIPDSRLMKQHLEDNGYDVTYEEAPGNHEWGFWDTYIQKILKWLPIQQTKQK